MPAIQTQCDYALAHETHHRCLKSEVARAAGGSAPACGNCDRGRPRKITEAQMARYKQDIADGWRNPDGSYCDREVYGQAVAKGMTPKQILAAQRAR
ncbi:MAG: hypothetical protein NW203_04870 [Hyphomonadaceae bacterium]|nr:hypothetical protein [Hyphomonadaceae bacterium]